MNASYQPAIKNSREGELVALRIEPDNPYDRNAIAIENGAGQIIGYLPRDNYLASAIHDRHEEPRVWIQTIIRAGGGHLGVVLSVDFDADKPSRIYRASYEPPRPRSFLSKWLG